MKNFLKLVRYKFVKKFYFTFEYTVRNKFIHPRRDRQLEYLIWRMSKFVEDIDIENYMKYARRYRNLILIPEPKKK